MKRERKIHPIAVVKNLSAERQEALLEFLDGDGYAARPHTLKEGLAWLHENGVEFRSTSSLSTWRSWYLLRRQLDLNEQTARTLLEDLKATGILETAEEELLAGQLFFMRLAMRQQDNAGFARVLRERSRMKSVKVMERRIALLESREAKIKEVIADSTLTPEEKEARVKEVWGVS